MPQPIEATPFTGPARLTIRLESLHAKANPELLGKAEYLLSFKVNGLERWQSPEPLKVGKGGTVPVGASVEVDVDTDTDYLDVEVHAAEQDLLSPDDHSHGSARLYRTAGFEAERGFTLEIEGEDTDIELRCSVDVEAL